MLYFCIPYSNSRKCCQIYFYPLSQIAGSKSDFPSGGPGKLATGNSIFRASHLPLIIQFLNTNLALILLHLQLDGGRVSNPGFSPVLKSTLKNLNGNRILCLTFLLLAAPLSLFPFSCFPTFSSILLYVFDRFFL